MQINFYFIMQPVQSRLLGNAAAAAAADGIVV